LTDAFRIALVLGFVVIVSVFLINGRYTIVASASNTLPGAYVMDRFTGVVRFCAGVICKYAVAPSLPRRIPSDVAPAPDERGDVGKTR
jgi:hypothetical protein